MTAASLLLFAALTPTYIRRFVSDKAKSFIQKDKSGVE
jgi:hypothetical protein